MNILLVYVLESMKDGFVFKLIANNYIVKIGDKKYRIEKELKENDFSAIVIDGEHIDRFDIVNFINEIKETKDGNKNKIIVLSSQNNMDNIKELMVAGIEGFVSKKYPTNEIIEKTINIINDIGKKGNEKRKHIRVDITRRDNASFSIRIPNDDKLITGKIINISMGGALLKLDDEEDMKYLKENHIFNNAQFVLNKWLISCDVSIVVIRNTYVGVRFYDIKENFQNYIAKFIFDRIAKK